jgi:uncharacterized membrane protein
VVSYRDDDVAAEERAAALEREVAELRARLAAVDLSSLHDDVMGKREELGEVERELAGIRRRAWISPGAIWGLLVLCFVLVLATMAIGFAARGAAR